MIYIKKSTAIISVLVCICLNFYIHKYTGNECVDWEYQCLIPGPVCDINIGITLIISVFVCKKRLSCPHITILFFWFCFVVFCSDYIPVPVVHK
jgi:hypothetical protein